MKIYRVEAKRWKRAWELHIEGMGVTQVKKLSDAEAAVRDYIALDLEVPADSFDVEIVPDAGPEIAAKVTKAQEAAAELRAAEQRAAASSRDVAGALQRLGMSGREIAAFLKVSPQRVSQLLRDRKDRSGMHESSC